MCVSPRTTQQLPHTFVATAVAVAEQDSLDSAGQPALERLREFKSYDRTSLLTSVNPNDTSGHLEGALRAKVQPSQKSCLSDQGSPEYREAKRYCQWRSFDAPT